MTKEEIENDAAEYLKTLTPDGWDDFEDQPTYNAVQLVKAIYHGYEQGYEDCRHYAHGYYKPKWHDLKKNPDDLPTESKEYWCKLKNGHYDFRIYYLDSLFYKSHWKELGIIAWCELPKFEE